MQYRAIGLGHRFGTGEWLYRGIDLELQPGKIYGVVGPSGSGKSTLLSVLGGLQEPTEGRVLFKPTAAAPLWVFQVPNGVSGRSVLDHVSIVARLSGASELRSEGLARAALKKFRLLDRIDEEFRNLSGGEAQRLMLSRATLSLSPILLLDEPTAQLDRRNAELVGSSLHSLADRGRVVIVATHDMGLAAQCDELIDLAGHTP